MRWFFPFALVVSLWALWQPAFFTPLRVGIPWILGLIMFGMGLTLTTDDFRGVWRRWRLVGVGLVAQYTIMPGLALGIALALGLPKEIVAGFVLLGASPGGTASNVVTYLARGNVALSVAVTLASTIVSPLLTPGLTWLLAGERVGVDVLGMMKTTLWIVALPVAGGVGIRFFAERWVRPMTRGLPVLSMILIVLVIGIVMALNRERILAFPGLIIAGVVLHNLLGLAIGYGTARLFTKDRADCRTLAIEVAMQNSGLAVALATKYLTSAAALPAALFSLWHNLSGVALATIWGRQRAHDGSPQEKF